MDWQQEIEREKLMLKECETDGKSSELLIQSRW